MNSDRKKSIQILLSHNILKPEKTSKEDFELAKSNGLMFDVEIQSHEHAIVIIQHAIKKIKKSQVTDSFLQSFGSGQLEERAIFPVFAIMQTFPIHDFEPYSTENSQVCRVCASNREKKVNRSFLNLARYKTGGVVTHDIYAYAFYLQQFNLMETKRPSTQDIDIFREILNCFAKAKPNETPSDIQKKIKLIAGFKSNEEQRRVLIDSLGFCSILETKEHAGFLKHYTCLELAVRKSRSSDWRYPVDFWTGKDGINKGALNFWFGEYEKIRTLL